MNPVGKTRRRALIKQQIKWSADWAGGCDRMGARRTSVGSLAYPYSGCDSNL